MGGSGGGRYLDGKHAVVTGGGRGIGAAITSALARRGARLTIMSRSAETLRQHAELVRSRHNAAVTAVECDVTDDESVRLAFQHAVEEFGPVQVLVNNAGAAESVVFARTTRDVWDRMLSVNLTSTYSCTSQVFSAMLEAGSGRIVNIASTAGVRGFKTMTAYCASKHGVVGLTRALALEAAKHGVTVNAVCPGYTDTAIAGSAIDNLVRELGRTPEEARAMVLRTIPRGRLTTPDEVASAVSWLCSPDAAAVTGISLPVAGGEIW